MIRVAWVPSLVLGGLAAAVALLLQNLLRDGWQIRTLPERVMEWALLFVPLDLFERSVARFGADAKTLALTEAFIGMGVSLVAIGALAVRMGWRSEHLLGLGASLCRLSSGQATTRTGGTTAGSL